jgi:hypothetical protein
MRGGGRGRGGGFYNVNSFGQQGLIFFIKNLQNCKKRSQTSKIKVVNLAH